MVRYLTPYLAVALAVCVLGGVAYADDRLSVAGVYLVLTVATLVAGGGYARWDAGHRPR